MFECDKCDKKFDNVRKLNGHKRVHTQKTGGDRTRGQNKTAQAASRYESTPQYCNQCNKKIPYEEYKKNRKKFCNLSCRAKFTNSKRGPRTMETKEKISKTLTRTVNTTIVGEYTTIWYNQCNHCGKIEISRSRYKYCSSHSHLYKSANRNRYAFTFSFKKYEDLFPDASRKLQENGGMWRPDNPAGLTRDHKVSVNESIRNGYDPFYIKHPLNCELMSWQDNNRKNTESSISYNELVKLVDKYELKKEVFTEPQN